MSSLGNLVDVKTRDKAKDGHIMISVKGEKSIIFLVNKLQYFITNVNKIPITTTRKTHGIVTDVFK